MKHKKLITTRKARGLSQIEMAKKIAMEQTTYSRIEIGKSHITDAEWEKFAKTLDVPVEDIKEITNPVSIKNENCTFNEGSIAGVQYVNIPQNVFDIIIKYNTKLEEENLNLKTALEKLK